MQRYAPPDALYFMTLTLACSFACADGIISGRFAEKHVPLDVRNIILAEAGANDGLGFPFLYIGLYLILIKTPNHPYHNNGGAILEW